MNVNSGGAWSRQRVAALVGQSEMFVLDASAELVAVPDWLLVLGAFETSEFPVRREAQFVGFGLY